MRELNVIRDIMRLKEYEGTKPIEDAGATMLSEIYNLAEQYEVTG